MLTPLYWIEGPWPGRLAIAPRPRGGEWLSDELQDWKKAGVDGVVSALTPSEKSDLDLVGESNESAKVGLWFTNFPISDRGVPESKTAMLAELKNWDERLQHGESIVIHCRQGIGRSSMLAASLLALEGVPIVDAWSRIEKARMAPVPDTPEQKAWVQGLVSSVKPSTVS